MIFLLLLLGFIAVAAGIFVLGLGTPLRETPFGAAALVAASVAITGGFILVGLAAAVSELRRVLLMGAKTPRAEMPQAVRPLERWDEEPTEGSEREVGPPFSPHTDSPDVIPARFDAPEVREREARSGSEPRPRYDADDIRGPSTSSPHSWSRHDIPPASDRGGTETGRTSAVSSSESFDTVRPSEYRRREEEVPERRTAVLPETGRGADEVRSPPLSPAQPGVPPAAPAEPRPVRILKTGVIREVSYTLFSDGSIETQMPEGTMYFASIEEFRRHLERSEG